MLTQTSLIDILLGEESEKSEMSTCPKCNTPNNDGSVYCSNCGIKLSTAVTISPDVFQQDFIAELFKRNGWEVEIDPDQVLRVKMDPYYGYSVRLHPLEWRIAFLTYWRLKDDCPEVDLNALANAINSSVTMTLSAILISDNGIRRMAVTTPILLTKSTLFSEVEAYLISAEEEWDRVSASCDFAEFLWRPEEDLKDGENS